MTHDQSRAAEIPAPPVKSVFIQLLPITLAVLIGFLTIGLQLPVLPLHLHQTLGVSTLVVGLVIGSQFAAALLSRSWAGNFADMRGPKKAVVAGMLIASSSGVVYLASLAFASMPTTSVWILVLGRILLALGESLIATGAMGWAVGLVGPQNTGKVMVWIGIAIFGAYALGAPVGVLVNSAWGFTGVAAAVLLIPLISLAIVAKVPAVAPIATHRTPFYKVLGTVWAPGLGLALSSVGFGLITAFIALLFAAKNWGNASLAFTAFGAAFIGARILFGHLPDKLGGAKVALVSVAIEAVGQLLIWQADAATTAYIGVALTGFGYSLAFPAFGVEAVRGAPPQTRSLAMGAYVAFLDIALGLTSPLAGALAGAQGIGSVYLAGAVSVALALIVAMALLARSKSSGTPASPAQTKSQEPGAAPVEETKKSGTKAIIASLAICAILFGLLYAWRQAKNGGGAPPARPPSLVSVAAAQSRQITDELQAIGSLQASREVLVAPDTSGRVTSINFTAGEIVKEGSVLVQLYDAPEQADLAAATARERFAKLQQQRAEALANSGAGSRELLEQSNADALQASAAVRQLQARIEQKKVRAAFPGQLGIRRVNLGQYLSAGEPVVSLTQLDPLYVNFSVPQQELPKLRPGAPVEVNIDALPGETFKAILSTIEPRVDAETRNVRLQATLRNDGDRLKSGMYATAMLRLSSAKESITVPLTAIQTSATGDSLMIVEDVNAQGVGKWTSKPVKLGRQMGEEVVIESGVGAGDLVIVAGQNRLQPSAPVKINSPGPDGTSAPSQDGR